MEPKIRTLEIYRYRGLQQLTIGGLGRVNLLTGRNNTGKSSVLEALRILATGASMSVLHGILHSREEGVGNNDTPIPPVDAEGSFPLSSLFHGFPQFSASVLPIVIASSGGRLPMKLSLEARWLSRDREQGDSWVISPSQPKLFDRLTAKPGVAVDFSGRQSFIPLEKLRRGVSPRPYMDLEMVDESRLPCVFVSPYGGERTATLGPLWDAIALSDREQDVVDALRIIDPEISAISMVGGESQKATRTAIVRASGFPRPVPLRSFGDGVNRLFGIALSLVNAKDGFLLIDEFENGLHHTVQTDAWRAIFKLAGRLDIQVVATSHSWDAIEAFQTAASESTEEGVLIRLLRKGDEIIPTLFREDELAVATRERIEVR